MIAVLGPPGCGKTTLTAALAPLCADPLTDVSAPLAAPAADAVLLLADATWTHDELQNQFERFAAFLSQWQADRSFSRTPAGLPVTLVLTKCDLLAKPGDDGPAWLAAVGAKLDAVADHFNAFAAARMGFGSLSVTTAATATHFPAGPAFHGLTGAYGVPELARAAAGAAAGFRGTVLRTRRRLTASVASLSAAAALLAVGLGVNLSAPPDPPPDPLLVRVQQFQGREGPPPVRFADRRRGANRALLAEVAADPGFARLPDAWQRYVTDRVAEYAAYAAYREKFDPPGLGPNDVRTAAEQAALDAALSKDLAPPPAYVESPAGRLAAKWAADLKLVRAAEDQLCDAFRTRVRREAELELTRTFDAAWRAQVETLLADPPTPTRESAIPRSETVPIGRGGPVTYSPVLDGDRVAAAKAEWEAAKERLVALGAVAAALGSFGPGPLDPPPTEATVVAAAVEIGRLPLNGLRLTRFPEPARDVLLARFRPAFATAVARAKARLTAPQPDATLAAWGRVLAAYRTVGGPEFGTGDPVVELKEFLELKSFTVRPAAVEITLPDDVRGRAMVPAGPFALTVEGTTHAFTPGPERRTGTATVVRYTATGGELSFGPKAAVTATAPFRAGGVEFTLTWDAKSAYPFDRLNRPPTAKGEVVPGVRVEFFPTAWPALPLLLAGD